MDEALKWAMQLSYDLDGITDRLSILSLIGQGGGGVEAAGEKDDRPPGHHTPRRAPQRRMCRRGEKRKP